MGPGQGLGGEGGGGRAANDVAAGRSAEGGVASLGNFHMPAGAGPDCPRGRTRAGGCSQRPSRKEPQQLFGAGKRGARLKYPSSLPPPLRTPLLSSSDLPRRPRGFIQHSPLHTAVQAQAPPSIHIASSSSASLAGSPPLPHPFSQLARAQLSHVHIVKRGITH